MLVRFRKRGKPVPFATYVATHLLLRCSSYQSIEQEGYVNMPELANILLNVALCQLMLRLVREYRILQ